VTTGYPFSPRRAWGIPVGLVFGHPVRLGPDDDPVAATLRLQRTTTDLLHELQRTYPDGAPSGAWWVPARLGGGAPADPADLANRPAVRTQLMARTRAGWTSAHRPAMMPPSRARHLDRTVENAMPRRDHHGDPRASWVYRFAAWLAFTVMRLQRWRVDVQGIEHLPRHGGVVIAANHTSFWDFFTSGWLPYRRWRRPVRILAKASLFSMPRSSAGSCGVRSTSRCTAAQDAGR
jgi:hypothetical protein